MIMKNQSGDLSQSEMEKYYECIVTVVIRQDSDLWRA